MVYSSKCWCQITRAKLFAVIIGYMWPKLTPWVLFISHTAAAPLAKVHTSWSVNNAAVCIIKFAMRGHERKHARHPNLVCMKTTAWFLIGIRKSDAAATARAQMSARSLLSLALCRARQRTSLAISTANGGVVHATVSRFVAVIATIPHSASCADITILQ